MSPYTGYLVETFVTLAAVCATAVIVLWGARRVGFARATGPIELRGYLPIDARRAIYLVKVGERVFVLGVGEGGFTKLGEVADRELPPSASLRAPSAFARVLARVSSSERPPETRAARDTSAPVPSMHLPVPSLHNPVPSVARPPPAAPHALHRPLPATQYPQPPSPRPDRPANHAAAAPDGVPPVEGPDGGSIDPPPDAQRRGPR